MDKLAAKYRDDASKFNDALKDRFINRQRRGFNYGEFTSTGFKDSFTDNVGPKNSPNQVYHYVGTFQAGYEAAGTLGFDVGYRSGLLVANQHETEYGIRRGARGGYEPYPLPDTPSHAADSRLNAVSVGHGALLGSGRIKPSELGNLIRKDVCK